MTAAPDYLVRRNGFWQYHRRVPKAYAGLAGKSKFVILSTKIRVADDPKGAKAARAAARLNEQQEARWRGLAAGTPAKQRYQDAVTLARSHGLDYLTPTEAALQQISALLARIEVLQAGGRKTDVVTVDAVLGAVEKPKIKLSDLFGEYELTQKTPLSKMSADQVRKWTSAKRRAVEILIEQRGDKVLQDLTRADALAYADYWEARTISEGISASSANKSISHVGGMIRAVDKRLKLGLDNVFAGCRLDGGRDGKRAPFTTDHIRNVILAPGALADLNEEARDVVYVVMETGCRPSEIVNLTKNRIVLDADVPHIRIAAEGRLLKTEHSERDIPLVGRALEAMKRHRAGFPRYHDKGSTLSATLMKHMKARKLLPTPKHSVYSLRHSFKDRLKAAEAPEELIDEVMGHANGKPRYGDGYGLQLKQRYLQAIAF
ncbi:tyrosine-type recombinase/integrase [Bradyrhizobium jicamae]|uniref:tyrosine-type recombinase/integrase n=1 Tax=Bradyrhizobium jicamae TaxID=280332 RepID=UPI001BA61188|nr:tyrosine-type recombinase/integrase [Bradyrhizobium jicamae]MBR0937292.1 tyrosine-type recombinase/integrase [Bradyrhizobium jicamae]